VRRSTIHISLNLPKVPIRLHGISPFVAFNEFGSTNINEPLELPFAKNTSEITSQLTVASLSSQAGATFC